ncbi:hypothetical protein BaRGS_00038671, partial [Batillaria attramentaria]
NVTLVITVWNLVKSVVTVVMMMSVTTTTDTVHGDVVTALMEICVTVMTASESSGGDIVGPVVGSVLGAGALIGLSILLAAIIRRQRSRDAPTSRDSDERREAQFSPEDAQARVDTEGLKTETSDADTHYESLEKYENPDDMKPYSTLEASHGRRTNVNIQGDKEAVLYHNVTGYKTQ